MNWEESNACTPLKRDFLSMLLDGLDATELPPWLLRTLTPGDLQDFLNRLRLAIAAHALPESGR